MFGYVTVGKNQMTADEYDVFRAYYCGLCRAMGKAASQVSRFGLSYDIAFLAIVLSSLADAEPAEGCGRCMAHPFKKSRYVKYDPVLEYCASAGVILGYAKLADDLCDDRSVKAALGMLALRRGFGRSRRRCPEVYDAIKERLRLLGELEKSGCASVDEPAEEFGRITELLFTPAFVTGEATRRALAWLGYNLGRWIYILDAYNDYESDIRTGSYNPFIAAGGLKADAVEMSLTITLSNIASAFELIDFKRNRDIIGKMIYISLRQKQDSILGIPRTKDVDE
ncbi:MAG: hypothetical protein IJH37_12010 [Clostridia bacterium]|nr:hypothetical protein [Clostridia bacterium]